MLVFVFRLLSRLPLSWLHIIGRLLGRLIYAVPGRYRARLRANAAQAGYADAAFARGAAAQAGAAMIELPWVWFRADEALTKVSATGAELIHAAHQAGRAILYLTPHVGCFEIAARFGARLGPITVLYRPPR